jgi:hypothetical protein
MRFRTAGQSHRRTSDGKAVVQISVGALYASITMEVMPIMLYSFDHEFLSMLRKPFAE